MPAVDVADGQAVRLVQGAAGSETAYGDPLEAALAWQRDGAEWVHLVDLDAAFGRGSNAALLADVIARLDVQGRALRRHPRRRVAARPRWPPAPPGSTSAPPRWRTHMWCDRVVGEYGDRVAIGLDVRGRTLSARGWTRDGGDLFEVLARLDKAGCARYVVTDILKDGTMRGPNLDLLRDVCAHTDAPVIASGGVSTLDDLRALAGLEPPASRALSPARPSTRARSRSPRRWRRSVAQHFGRRHDVERYGSGGPWEDIYGYSRVVKAGPPYWLPAVRRRWTVRWPTSATRLRRPGRPSRSPSPR